VSDDLPELTIDQVASRLGQPDFFVFDNNGYGRWVRGHAAGELPPDKTATLLFYCSGPG